MSTFSETLSSNGKFKLKLESDKEDNPLKLFVQVIVPKKETVTVSDLAFAIYRNCLKEDFHSFQLGKNAVCLPCEVSRGMKCRYIEISWFDSYDEVLRNIASQISI